MVTVILIVSAEIKNGPKQNGSRPVTGQKPSFWGRFFKRNSKARTKENNEVRNVT